MAKIKSIKEVEMNVDWWLHKAPRHQPFYDVLEHPEDIYYLLHKLKEIIMDTSKITKEDLDWARAYSEK